MGVVLDQECGIGDAVVGVDGDGAVGSANTANPQTALVFGVALPFEPEPIV